MIDDFHVLNLGAGVQSTTVYLLNLQKKIKPRFDYAIFADVGEEPTKVYEHLEWMKLLDGPQIIVGSWGHRLGDQLRVGMNSTGQRFVSIPAFTAREEGKKTGIVRRQCTKEYKIEVIDRIIRRNILGLAPRQRIPKSIKVYQHFGISKDEIGRATKIYENWIMGKSPFEPQFPLLELGWERKDCVEWLREFGNVPHEVPRSACVFCPFRSNAEWVLLKLTDPEGFARAIEIDEALRIPGNVCNRNMEDRMYVHPSCIPLVQIDFSIPAPPSYDFGNECEGMCGV